VAFTAELSRPWRILVMSDGVWKYAGWDQVIEVGQEMRVQEISACLRNRASIGRNRTLQDDFTLVILEGLAD
jgi:hypothetical protein